MPSGSCRDVSCQWGLSGMVSRITQAWTEGVPKEEERREGENGGGRGRRT